MPPATALYYGLWLLVHAFIALYVSGQKFACTNLF